MILSEKSATFRDHPLFDHEADLHVTLPKVVAEPAIAAVAPIAAPGIEDAKGLAVVVESDHDHGVAAAEIAILGDDSVAAPSHDGRPDAHAEDDRHPPGQLLLDHGEVGGVEPAPVLDAVAPGALLFGWRRL